MTASRLLAMPWASNDGLYCVPGRVILKIALGEAPAWIPTIRDVQTGAHPPARSFGIREIDRILQSFSATIAIARQHGAQASRHQFGARHLEYSEAEQVFGLARSFRIETDHDVHVGNLVDALRQVTPIESAAPHYLCVVPAAAAADAAAGSDRAWASRELIRVPEALAYEPGDGAVIVGLIDTGVHLDHEEFVGKLRPGFDTVQLGQIDVAGGIRLLGDLREEDMDPEDEVGHGTCCAGIITARGDSVPPGAAGDCTVVPMRVLGSATMPGKTMPVGIGALPDIDDGLKRAIDLGAKVLNLSFGTSVDALDSHDEVPHADVVRYGLARGCIFVAASGNTGRPEVFSPACLEGVIAVGACDDGGEPCHFSTRGDHVAICAPGERVVSTGLAETVSVTGTSFAAPFVTAAAAMLVARAARHAAPVDGPLVSRILRDSAQPFPGATPTGYGRGILDIAAALRLLDWELDRSPQVARSFPNDEPIRAPSG